MRARVSATLILIWLVTGCDAKWWPSVKRVNELRALHGAPPVRVNANLSWASQNWANQMAQYKLWKHSAMPYGENIAGGWSPSLKEFKVKNKNDYVLTAIDLWYREIDKYDFEKPKWSPTTGHFTQLVWINTREIGIGVSYHESSKTVYVVMNYDPPGNWPRGFAHNVLPMRTTPLKVQKNKGRKMM
jgi:glioma pathogenesis-related protein 2